MSWAKLDDGFDSHRKLDGVSLEAVGLWARGLSYSARYLTDGHLDHTWLRARVPGDKKRERLIEELLDARLLDEADGRYFIYHFLEYNFSRAQVEEKREKEREKKAAQREARGSGRTGRADLTDQRSARAEPEW